MAVQTEGFLDKLKKLTPGKLRDQVKKSANWFRQKVKEVQGRTFPSATKLASCEPLQLASKTNLWDPKPGHRRID